MIHWSLFRKAMRRKVILAVLIVSLLGAGFFLSNPINRLRIRLTWEDLHTADWKNGLWSIFKAPADANPEGLVSAYYAFHNMPPASFKILKWEKVSLGLSSEIYTVALVGGPSGQKLVVFNHNSTGWSAREYDP